MPSKPVLSEDAKAAIRQKLRTLCEEYWTAQGYKKTSIKNLCDHAGISIGTFYTLYPAKEDLFLDTIEHIQARLKEMVLDTTRRRQSKEGFAQAVKELVREYDKKPFLYHVNTPDFQSFITKLPENALQKIKFDSVAAFHQAAQAANLTLKMEPSRAYGMLSALLAASCAKETLSAACDYFDMIDCMADILVDSVFEERR